MGDHISEALQRAFPRPDGAPDPVHDKCGQSYERFNLLGHLQTCPKRPTEEDLCRALDRMLGG